jgi:hypothetical protein
MPPSLPAMLDRREPGEEPAAEGGGMKSRLARKFGENRGKTLGQTADLCAPSRQTREGCSADQAFANPVPLRERERRSWQNTRTKTGTLQQSLLTCTRRNTLLKTTLELDAAAAPMLMAPFIRTTILVRVSLTNPRATQIQTLRANANANTHTRAVLSKRHGHRHLQRQRQRHRHHEPHDEQQKRPHDQQQNEQQQLAPHIAALAVAQTLFSPLFEILTPPPPLPQSLPMCTLASIRFNRTQPNPTEPNRTQPTPPRACRC